MPAVWLACGLAAFLPVLAIGGELVPGDGDSLRRDREQVRLWGIDAPELDQTCSRHGRPYQCGRDARAALAGLMAGGEVACVPVERDRHGRTVARCSVDGLDLAAEMVRRGWAFEYRRYSGGVYADLEAEARSARRGLWAGEFVRPWRWRRTHER